MNNKSNLIYRFLRIILRMILILFFNVKITGYENTKNVENVVIVANHKSWIDPLLVMAFLPPIKFAIIAEQVSKIQIPFVKWLIKICELRFIEIDRGSNKSRLKGYLTSVKHVKHGGSIMIFPEGRLNQEDDKMHPFFLGPFQIAITSGAKILPLYFRGTEELYFRRKINLSIGKLIPTDSSMDKEDLGRSVYKKLRDEIKPKKPVNNQRKKRLNITNLMINGVLKTDESKDIIIKGRESTQAFSEFNNKHKDDY